MIDTEDIPTKIDEETRSALYKNQNLRKVGAQAQLMTL